MEPEAEAERVDCRLGRVVGGRGGGFAMTREAAGESVVRERSWRSEKHVPSWESTYACECVER